MTVKLSRMAPALGAVIWLASSSLAPAQWFPFAGLFRPCPCGYGCGSACGPRIGAPIGDGCPIGACGLVPTAAIGNACGCASPVVAHPVTETFVRQIPVTEYHQMRQTVKKPVIETTYVDQPVTEYRQIVEQKTINVPTCSYQDITESRSVQRNCGQWVTKWHCNPKVNPCQYDNRPGLAGELNRTGFAIRQAFIPSQYATREYQTQVVTQQIPITRRVAVQGTKQVTCNVARVVPTQTTRKVAVNTVKYIDEEVVVLKPVTVVKSIPSTRTTYRFVPAGSTLALAPVTTNTALLPTPDPVSSARSPSKTQSAARDNDKTRSTDVPAKKSSFENNDVFENGNDSSDDGRRANRDDAPKSGVRFVAARMPDSARVTGWRPTAIATQPDSAPRSERAVPAISVADRTRY